MKEAQINEITIDRVIDEIKKGDPVAIVATKDGIKLVELPEFGSAGLRMINHKLDRVEYSYTKK